MNDNILEKEKIFMYKMIICGAVIGAVLILTSIGLDSSAHKKREEKIYTLAKLDQVDWLMDAMVKVESYGNCDAIGALGEIGPLQIQKVVVREVNSYNFNPVIYTLRDRTDLKRSKEICRLYMEYWGERALKNGATSRLEAYARCWNGGPNGWAKPSTLDYWHKVVLVLGETK